MELSASPQPRISDYLGYGLCRCLEIGFSQLPEGLSIAFGQSMAALTGCLNKRYCRRVEEQLQLALGVTVAEAQELRRKVYRHYGLLAAEFFRMGQMSSQELLATMTWNDSDLWLEELYSQGRGVILVGGHVGNWEYNGVIMTLRKLMRGAIARPLGNPLLNNMLNRIRATHGEVTFEKRGAMVPVLKTLKSGGGVAILVDQDAGDRGLFAPFFGIPASTIAIVADLAIRTGAPIAMLAIQRQDNQLFNFAAGERAVLYADKTNDKAAERLRLITEINANLEKFIRQAPEQWLWIHRRWKTRPVNEKETIVPKLR